VNAAAGRGPVPSWGARGAGKALAAGLRRRQPCWTLHAQRSALGIAVSRDMSPHPRSCWRSSRPGRGWGGCSGT
jgi:hypothetical protein